MRMNLINWVFPGDPWSAARKEYIRSWLDVCHAARYINGCRNLVVGEAEIHIWLLLKDRLNTRNILRRVLDDYSCPLCTASVEETSQHLFFTCSFSQWCWQLLNIQWHMNMEIKERIVQGRRDFESIIFREVLLVVIWAIWTHQNEVIFAVFQSLWGDGRSFLEMSIVLLFIGLKLLWNCCWLVGYVI